MGNEAMAAGLPVLVSSAVGCAEDLVQEDETVSVFEPGDVSAMADALVLIDSDAASGRRDASGQPDNFKLDAGQICPWRARGNAPHAVMISTYIISGLREELLFPCYGGAAIRCAALKN